MNELFSLAKEFRALFSDHSLKESELVRLWREDKRKRRDAILGAEDRSIAETIFLLRALESEQPPALENVHLKELQQVCLVKKKFWNVYSFFLAPFSED
jgi:hypothetical protein